MPMSDDFRQARYAEIKKIVVKHKGELKTKTYTILQAPMRVRCREGHNFSISSKNLLRGLWCEKCRPLSRQLEFLKEAKKVARSRKGKLLSTSYKTARIPLEWQCHRRHKWKATYDNVVNKDSWCPACSLEGASERKQAWWDEQKVTAKRKKPGVKARKYR